MFITFVFIFSIFTSKTSTSTEESNVVMVGGTDAQTEELKDSTCSYSIISLPRCSMCGAGTPRKTGASLRACQASRGLMWGSLSV